jgi:hypothetical protein
MNTLMPFCEECGQVGVMLSGMHPGEAGIVRWAIYSCGHTRTEVTFDEVPAADGTDLLPAAPARD